MRHDLQRSSMEAPAILTDHILPEPCRGATQPAFATVAEAFAENFRRRGENGAALCVYHRGAKVVDLWGGERDPRDASPWLENTLVCGFSTSKGVAAVAVALAVARGHLAYDAPVARYWPEFGARGKGEITVRELLGHLAGLSHLDRRLNLTTIGRPTLLARRLARQRPIWHPGRHWGYHAMTWGFYVDEVMRRVTPGARSTGRFFADEIAGPLGLDYHIGLPDPIPDARIARIELPGRVQVLRGLPRLPRALVPKVINPFSRLQRSLRVVRGFNVNDPAWLKAEVSSANGVGEVRALARLYSVLACGGNELGLGAEVMAELTAPAAIPSGGNRDIVMGVDSRWHLGFAKSSPDFPFGTGDTAFGMPGMGGAFAFADPDRELGYAYVPRRLGIVPFDEPRETAVREAVYQCLPTR